ncbi:hypothetical protein GF373_00205, partial [bacterium]|nr:hypothetical protein [bacterium]
MIKTHKLSSMMALISLLCLLTALPGQAASGSDIWLEFFTHGDIDRALSAFEESVSESSGDALAHAGLAMLAPSRQTDIDVVEHYFLALENGLDTPQAAYYLEEIQRKISGQEEYAEAVKRYERMLKGNELNAFLRDSLQFYRAKLLQKLGRWEEAEAAFNQLNFITSFWYCGVFDNAEKGGHEQTFGPEENLDLRVAYKGKRGQVNWRPIPLQPYDGYIDLHGFAAPSKEASTYLVTQLNSSQNQQCTLKLGHAGAVKGWLNGEPVLDVARYHPVQPDQVVVDITLQKGNNILLLKISSSETGKYGFYLRMIPQNDGFITVDNLKGNEDLTASTPKSSQLPDSDVLIEPKPFQQLKALADAPEARPYHLLFYALLLQRLH